MKLGEDWLVLESVESTQSVAAERLATGYCPDVIYAKDQLQGRGRLGREWLSQPDQSLTMSLVFKAYADHPKPWLVGMAVGLDAAVVMGCQIRWPNDLVSRGRKLGGVLTEMFTDTSGRKVPVVGLGLNLSQESFPPSIAAIATSHFLETGVRPQPEILARRIVASLSSVPEPLEWSDLELLWSRHDDTVGKVYRTVNGKEAIAEGIGPDGELLARVDGVQTSVMAAEAMFGE